MLRADVPVGSYLSGGLDSSLVAALGLRAKGAQFTTFSLRFEDAEYDETSFQRLMAERLGSEHHEVLVSRDDIARVFPGCHPAHRAPDPAHRSGAAVPVVEAGARRRHQGRAHGRRRRRDVRRLRSVPRGQGPPFLGARIRESTWRRALLERLYPYLARSPVAQKALSRQFFGQNLGGWREPGFGHDMRWRSTAALRRLFSPDITTAVHGRDVRSELLATLPGDFTHWSPLAQDQYLEIRTLLSGYLLSSQGDRMLMAHSVEGRFPFLDRQVAALADSLPARYKLRVLDEKHVLKRVAADLVPPEVLPRKKQPYRAPDALSFTGAVAAEWIEEVASETGACGGWCLHGRRGTPCAGQVPRASRDRGSSRTPTTWRSSASCPRSSCSTS